MIRTVLTSGYQTVVDQIDQDPSVPSSAVHDAGVAVSPQKICIWEVSIGIPDL